MQLSDAEWRRVAKMNADLLWRMRIGCLGALTPILINVLIVDLQTALSNITLVSAVFYAIRIVALCAAACLVVYLNSDETKPIKLFQLGIAAPALLTGMINGAAITKQQNNTTSTPQNAVHGSFLDNGSGFVFQLSGVITLAQAQEANLTAGVLNCTKPPEPTFSQQALKGFLGVVPDNQWFVVVESDLNPANSIDAAKSINQKNDARFKAAVCAPVPPGNKFFRVVIGQYLTLSEANALRGQAIAAGFTRDTYVWNPFAQ
jgi:hypothetical protein